jgi:hypothetical protein
MVNSGVGVHLVDKLAVVWVEFFLGLGDRGDELVRRWVIDTVEDLGDAGVECGGLLVGDAFLFEAHRERMASGRLV